MIVTNALWGEAVAFWEKAPHMHREAELNQTQFGANRSLQAGSPSNIDIRKNFNYLGSNCRGVDAICTAMPNLLEVNLVQTAPRCARSPSYISISACYPLSCWNSIEPKT